MATPSPYTEIHKRLALLFPYKRMKESWKKARSTYHKDTKRKLPTPAKKYPEELVLFNEWVETKILETFGPTPPYFIKQELKDRGWDEKILTTLNVKPTKIINLGRGRKVYYYDSQRIEELEDTSEFGDYVAIKLERKYKREARKLAKSQAPSGFGSEFIH